MKLPIIAIEILFAGTNSVLGGICKEGKHTEMDKYCWLVLANPDSLNMLEDECKELKLQEYIIADRKSMKIKNLKE